MFKITITTIGKTKEKWLLEGLHEYEKRLQHTLVFQWNLFETAKAFEAALETQSGFIALDPKGTLFTSEILSQKLFREWGTKTHFIIGGPDGLKQELLQKAKCIWSLSPLTFTHQMTRLILAEQLYRALEIEKNSGYHRYTQMN